MDVVAATGLVKQVVFEVPVSHGRMSRRTARHSGHEAAAEERACDNDCMEQMRRLR
jgi:hypothetical protein